MKKSINDKFELPIYILKKTCLNSFNYKQDNNNNVITIYM